MPIYPAHNYTEFVRLARARGSGLDRTWHRDGSLKALGGLLQRDSTSMLVSAAISALGRQADAVHGSKLRKYREAIAFIENTFPILPGLRQAPVGMGVEAVRYVRNPVAPTAQFVGAHLNHGTLSMSPATAQVRAGMTVPEFMEANAASTRVVLIHLGGVQQDMDFSWDGLKAVDHMNLVLTTAAEQQIHVCILRDPHQNGPGAALPTAANAVCAGLRHAVNQLPGTHVWVADGGANHSAFHDPAFQAWLTAPGVTQVVVMGFDADICVRGNVFGVAEEEAGSNPRRIVPAMINFVDVVTARPLLSGGAAGTVQAIGSWGSLCFTRQD